ncbi:rhodanese-like domain containing protein [[Synechococcus] sp. NIES-970]|nr:rhodanese-like domain containing protein [[Synechococcus] sp. NIES-970]
MSDRLTIREIQPDAFAQRQAETKALQLIDVREPFELEIVALEGFQNLPLSQFEQWSPRIAVDFDPTAETYVLCHHGMRSAQMCQWLLQNGFVNVINIAGGIHSYALSVDRQLPRY